MLALLLGTLSLFAAAPAEASHPFGTPTNLQAQAGNAQVTLTWGGGNARSTYTVAHGEHPSGTLSTQIVQAAANRTVTITSLTNNTTYRFRVRERGHSGHTNSAWTSFVTATPSVPTAPSAPTGLTVTPGNAQLSVSWTAPSGTVTGYDVHYTSSTTVAAGATVQTVSATAGWLAVSRSGTTASQTISSLTNSTPYRVRVRATNSAGNSAWVEQRGTPSAVQVTQAAPTGLTVTPGNAELRVSWTAPSGSFTGYKLEITSALAGTVANNAAASGSNPATAWIAVATPANTSTSYTIDSNSVTLTNGVTYRVRLRTTTPDSAWAFSSGTPRAPQVSTLTVTLSASPNPVTEGSSVTVTARLSAAASSQVTIPVTITDNTAEPADHGTLASITIASGATTGTGTITTNQDSGNNDETFTVSLGTLPSGVTAGTPSSVLVRIRDDERLAAVTLKVRPNPVDEGALFTVEVGVSAPLSGLNFPVTVRNGTAETLDWGSRQSHSKAVRDGGRRWYNVRVWSVGGQNVASGAKHIPTHRDSDTKDETLIVELGTLPAGYAAGTPSRVTVTIRDITEPPGNPVSLRAQDVREGEDVLVEAFVSLSQQNPVTIPLVVTQGTSEEGDHGTIESITIPAGANRGTRRISTVVDTDSEDETFTVALGTPLPTGLVAGTLPSVEVTIHEGEVPADTPTDTGTQPTGGGGGGGGGSGTPPPGEDSPPGEEPQDPEQPDDCADNDRENLVRFYDAADGDNWDDNTNWKSEEPLDQWYGVDTDEDGEVISLRLADNNLSGDMPTEELLCLNEDTEIKELALWDNDGLLGEVPDELARAVERAVLRDVAAALELNTQWFDDYEDPFNFSDWHSGVTTDGDGRVTELDFTGEDITGEIPGRVFEELRRLRVIKTGCGVTLEVEAPERVSVMMPDDCPEETAPEDMEEEEEEEEETAASGGGGCALGQGDFSVSGFGLFLVTLLVFAALWRKRARSS